MTKYHIYGAGLTGLTIGRILTDKGNQVTIFEKSDHIGGMMSTHYDNGIEIHDNGAHLFHTDSEEVYRFVTKYTEVIPYKHQVKSFVTKLEKELYITLPLSLQSLSDITGIPKTDPDKLHWILSATSGMKHPNKKVQELISKIGWDLYDYVIKPYSEKQWGCKFEDVPEGVIDRIGMTDDFNTYYFKDKYQFLPKYGYKKFLENLAEGLDIKLSYSPEIDDSVITIFTGPIDDIIGKSVLPYRSLKWDSVIEDTTSYQLPVLNLPQDPKYTRKIIHNNFENNRIDIGRSLVSYEYSINWRKGLPRYYPVNNKTTDEIYNNMYHRASFAHPNLIMAGRLGKYKYLDMDDAILEAIKLCETL